MTEFWRSLLMFILGGVVGAFIGFLIARKVLNKQLAENPPINEKMIRAMFMQMGRKPSEAQIKQVLKSVNSYKN